MNLAGMRVAAGRVCFEHDASPDDLETAIGGFGRSFAQARWVDSFHEPDGYAPDAGDR